MTTFYPFLSLGDVYDYLPKFDPDYDLQVGDWVMIKPWRASVLLSPLIAAWESRSQTQNSAAVDSSCAPAPQFKLNQLLPEPLNLRRRSLAWDSEGTRVTSLRLPRLAPLSMARTRFCQRKRGHVVRTSAKRDEECGGEYMEAETDDLFFHIRLGLLTPSRPYIFGGLDIVEVLAWPPEDDSAEEDVASDVSSDSQRRPEPCTMYLNLLTGETLTRDEAVDRATKAFAYSSSTPSWSSPIEEAAEKEWQQWVARRSSKCPQLQPCN